MALSELVRVVVVDDHPGTLRDVKLQMEQYPAFVIVGTCNSVQEAVTVIPVAQPDLLLLDIHLADGTGFDIIEKLTPLSFKVIFLTAYQEHAVKAIKYGALDYLLKPLDSHELKQALDRVLQSKPTMPEQIAIAKNEYNQEGLSRIVINSHQYLHLVELLEIVYCHGEGSYTTFHLTGGRKITASKHLKEYESLLPSNLFLRVHQSYLLNNRFIEKYQHKKGFIVLKEGTEIPVSIRRRDFVTSFLSKEI